MRKRLFKIYNVIAAYPVLALLCIAIGLLVYIGGQYKPVEQSFARKQAALMQLKQKAKGLEKDLVEVEMIDLAKRYALFNQDFLAADELESETLSSLLESSLRAHGWQLERSEAILLDDDKPEAEAGGGAGPRLRAVMLQIEAVSLSATNAAGEPFLPLYSATQAMRFMWVRPPTKEYQRIQLSRLDAGYRLEASIFMPLRDVDSADESEKESEKESI